MTGGKGNLSSCSVENAAEVCISDSMCGMSLYVNCNRKLRNGDIQRRAVDTEYES